MSIIRVDVDIFEKKIQLDTKLVGDPGEFVIHASRSDPEGLATFISRKVVDLEDKAVRDALVKLGWTPPSKEENHGYMKNESECDNDERSHYYSCNNFGDNCRDVYTYFAGSRPFTHVFTGVNFAKQCQNCVSAEKTFINHDAWDNNPQSCPEGIRFCTKNNIKVPAEWDGCKDGFEPLSTEYPNPPVQEGKETAQESSESDQDQVCADLAERNRELEERCNQLENEVVAYDGELEERCDELDKLQADHASLKVALRQYRKLDGKYRLLEGDETILPGDEFYNFDIQKFVSIPYYPSIHSVEFLLNGKRKVSALKSQGRKAIIRRKIVI